MSGETPGAVPAEGAEAAPEGVEAAAEAPTKAGETTGQGEAEAVTGQETSEAETEAPTKTEEAELSGTISLEEVVMVKDHPKTKMTFLAVEPNVPEPEKDLETRKQEALDRIKKGKEEQNARRNSSTSSGYESRIAKVLCKEWPIGAVKTNAELELIAEMNGCKYSSIGSVTTWMVRAGLADRVRKGHYKLLAKPMT